MAELCHALLRVALDCRHSESIEGLASTQHCTCCCCSREACRAFRMPGAAILATHLSTSSAASACRNRRVHKHPGSPMLSLLVRPSNQKIGFANNSYCVCYVCARSQVTHSASFCLNMRFPIVPKYPVASRLHQAAEPASLFVTCYSVVNLTQKPGTKRAAVLNFCVVLLSSTTPAYKSLCPTYLPPPALLPGELQVYPCSAYGLLQLVCTPNRYLQLFSGRSLCTRWLTKSPRQAATAGLPSEDLGLQRGYCSQNQAHNPPNSSFLSHIW
jgi:hypothetical protein